jgi:GntR family transcriptional repressor for pyruvate dehydrogenase complex
MKKDIQFQPKKRQSLTEEVTSSLLEQIESGELKEGDVLPSEQELAGLFQVSRPVVREALARLKYDGLIESRQGSGPIIAPASNRRSFLIKEYENSTDDTVHLFELRLILEGEAAFLASVRRTDEQLGLLKESLDRMEEAITEGRSGVEGDVDFHNTLTLACGNPYLRDFLNFLNTKIYAMVEKARQKSDMQPVSAQIVQDEHLAIYNAIKDRDSSRAREAICRHLVNSAKRQNVMLPDGYKISS